MSRIQLDLLMSKYCTAGHSQREMRKAGCIRDEGLPKTSGNLLERPDNQRLGKERSDNTVARFNPSLRSSKRGNSDASDM